MFIVPNPKFHQLQKLNKSTRFCNPMENLAHGNIFPLGKLYLDGPVAPMDLVKENTSIELRPLQKPVFEDIKRHKGALIYAKTGSGKTVLSTALHEVWGGKTLILVHSLDNVDYFYETFQKFIGVEAGRHCTGKKEIKDVTITTFTTFRKKYEMFAQHVHEDGFVGFNNLIVDEADAYFTKKARQSIIMFPSDRVFGFTGTMRTIYDQYLEGMPALQRFYGHLCTAEDDDSKDPLKGIFYKKYTKEYYESIEGKKAYVRPFDWVKFRELLDEDVDRKQEQYKWVLENSKEEDHTLVLFDRVADVEAFYAKAQREGVKSFMIHGSLKKKDREETIKNFYSGGGYLFAQYRTVGRGYDNDKLTRCFILFPAKGENNIRQMFGRVLRWLDGKKSYMYLWYDSELEFQHFARIKVCKAFFHIMPQAT